MTVTLATFITLCRERLADPLSTYWTDAELADWINDGIMEYSQVFPRIRSTAFFAVVNQREYDLPYDCRAITRVQYTETADHNTDPYRYLTRKPLTDPDFFVTEYAYDWVKRLEDDASSDPQCPWLMLSFLPDSASDSIAVEYRGEHTILVDAADVSTVPHDHINLIVQYVVFLAFQFRASHEMLAPADPFNNQSGIFSQNAVRAERLYRSAVAAAQKAHAESNTAVWHMDKWDRIY